MIPNLAEKVWLASRKESRIARTVVLKLKTREFSIPTRSHAPTHPISSGRELADLAMSLRGRVGLNQEQCFRLVGVGLSNFRDAEDALHQPLLFAQPDILLHGSGDHEDQFPVRAG
jgi:DNA polymerase-4